MRQPLLRSLTTLLAAATLLVACSSTPVAPGSFVVGGARPALVVPPPDHDPSVPTPLLVVLHGYQSSADQIEQTFPLATAAEVLGVAVVRPQGAIDSLSRRFWNASEACCNLYGFPVDDVGYLDAAHRRDRARDGGVAGDVVRALERWVHVVPARLRGPRALRRGGDDRRGARHRTGARLRRRRTRARAAHRRHRGPRDQVRGRERLGPADPVHAGRHPALHGGRDHHRHLRDRRRLRRARRRDPLRPRPADRRGRDRAARGSCPEGRRVALWRMVDSGHEPRPASGFVARVLRFALGW